MNHRLRVTILLFQLLASGAVCLNHLSITLIKGLSPFFSSPVFSEPAEWGIVFLFCSSGFLTEAMRASLVPMHYAPVLAELAFVCRRYCRLILPVLVAVVFDKFVVGFSNLSGPASWLRALPNLVTLSQTWNYNLLGRSTVPLPLGSSNMAWLGSNLFFVTLVYASTHRLVARLSVRAALLCVVGCALLYCTQYWVLWAETDRVNRWAAMHYGADLPAAYSVWFWLFEYCPYTHAASFLSGVFLARAVTGHPAPSTVQIPVLCALAVVLAVSAPLSLPRYLGLSLLLLAALQLAFTFSHSPEASTSRSAWADRLGACAYELFILHLVFYSLFTMTAPPPITAFSVVMLCGRVIAASALTLLLTVGLTELVIEPVRARLISFFGLIETDDRYA